LRSHVPRSNTHGGGNCSSTRVFRMPILNTHNLDAGIEAILLFEDHQKSDLLRIFESANMRHCDDEYTFTLFFSWSFLFFFEFDDQLRGGFVFRSHGE